MASICVELSSVSQALWMSWFSHTGLWLMPPAFPQRALVVWGVSFRPVQKAKQESGERSAADKQPTHPRHCWWPHRNNSSSLGVAEKACSRESSKANKGMLSTYQRGSLATLCLYLVRDEELLYCRWYVSVFPLLVCLHSHCDCRMITFQALQVCVFVLKVNHK